MHDLFLKESKYYLPLTQEVRERIHTEQKDSRSGIYQEVNSHKHLIKVNLQLWINKVVLSSIAILESLLTVYERR